MKQMHFHQNKILHQFELLTFNTLGHVKVDNNGHISDVDTTPGNIGSNQDVFDACFETCEGVLSLLLTLASVEGDGVILQITIETVNQYNVRK